MFKIGDKVRSKESGKTGVITHLGREKAFVEYDRNPPATEVSARFEIGDKVIAQSRFCSGGTVVRIQAGFIVVEDSNEHWWVFKPHDLQHADPAASEVSGIVIDNYDLGISINGQKASIHDFTDSQLESLSALCEMELMERHWAETTEDGDNE